MFSLGLGRSWKQMIENNTAIWNYFFQKSNPSDIKSLTINSDNIYNVLDVFNTAFMEYSVFKLTNLRVSYKKFTKFLPNYIVRILAYPFTP